MICLIQHFEADFPKNVSLKILNTGIVLKTFTHVLCLLVPSADNICKQFSPYKTLAWSSGFKLSGVHWYYKESVYLQDIILLK